MKKYLILAVVGLALSPASAMIGSIASRTAMSLGDLTFSVYPRIFSPNGDGANDKAGFHFDNPQDVPVQGRIYDLAGAKVADLTSPSDPAIFLVWDGKDAGGRAVPGGIYLYQLDYQDKHATGTVIVAR